MIVGKCGFTVENKLYTCKCVCASKAKKMLKNKFFTRRIHHFIGIYNLYYPTIVIYQLINTRVPHTHKWGQGASI